MWCCVVFIKSNRAAAAAPDSFSRPLSRDAVFWTEGLDLMTCQGRGKERRRERGGEENAETEQRLESDSTRDKRRDELFICLTNHPEQLRRPQRVDAGLKLRTGPWKHMWNRDLWWEGRLLGTHDLENSTQYTYSTLGKTCWVGRTWNLKEEKKCRTREKKKQIGIGHKMWLQARLGLFPYLHQG